jgi:hypothetical protein
MSSRRRAAKKISLAFQSPRVVNTPLRRDLFFSRPAEIPGHSEITYDRPIFWTGAAPGAARPAGAPDKLTPSRRRPKDGVKAMTLTRITLAALLLLALAPAAAAQDPKQALNEELYEAARKGDAAEVRAVLDKGADVNARFRYGATALFKAAERGHTEVVKLLIERGADVNVKDTFYGATAMTWALDKGHTGVVRALLAKSAEGAGNVLLAGVRSGNAELAAAALETGKVPAGTLTAALVVAGSDEKKAAIAESLKKAGAQPPPAVDAGVLQSYAGKYRGDPGPEINIEFKDGRLVGTGGGPPLTLFPLDQTTFRPAEFDGITLTFKVEAGKVTGIDFKQGPNVRPLKRVDSGQ